MTASIDLRRCALAATFLVIAGCATTQPVQPLDFDRTLPHAAAEYRTEVAEEGAPATSSRWRIWRDTDRIERENLDAQRGEVWQRDGNVVFHSQIWHAYQRGIEFQSGDLGMVGGTPDWTQQAWIVSPQLLQSLPVVSEKSRDGVTYRRYRGRHADADWDITMRLDYLLPVSIKRSQPKHVERIELVEAHELSQAPWQPTPSREYEMIDFADLGDRERDPYIQQMLAEAGHAHAHAH